MRADLPPPRPRGDDLGLVEHPAANVEPGDVAELAEGGARYRSGGMGGGSLAALLEVTPTSESFANRVHRVPGHIVTILT
jgi:hypothetical protein